MEIIRQDELQELLDVVNVKPYGKFLITGAAGSGKTFLLNILGKILEEQGKKIALETMAFSWNGNRIWEYPTNVENHICLVDGLDEVYRYRHIVECKKMAENALYVLLEKIILISNLIMK